MIRRLLRALRSGSAATPSRAVSPAARARPSAPRLPSPDQDRELLLYKFDTCPFCVRVMREIDRLGLEVPRADTRRDPGARDALRELTGGTQVPCLVIDGQPLLESADINAWLREYAAR